MPARLFQPGHAFTQAACTHAPPPVSPFDAGVAFHTGLLPSSSMFQSMLLMQQNARPFFIIDRRAHFRPI